MKPMERLFVSAVAMLDVSKLRPARAAARAYSAICRRLSMPKSRSTKARRADDNVDRPLLPACRACKREEASRASLRRARCRRATSRLGAEPHSPFLFTCQTAYAPPLTAAAKSIFFELYPSWRHTLGVLPSPLWGGGGRGGRSCWTHLA